MGEGAADNACRFAHSSDSMLLLFYLTSHVVNKSKQFVQTLQNSRIFPTVSTSVLFFLLAFYFFCQISYGMRLV